MLRLEHLHIDCTDQYLNECFDGAVAEILNYCDNKTPVIFVKVFFMTYKHYCRNAPQSLSDLFQDLLCHLRILHSYNWKWAYHKL